MNKKYLFTSESVTEGHPDKIADQISDAILDEVLRGDPQGRVGIEALVSAENITISGQIRASYKPDITDIVRQVIYEIGYTDNCYGLNPDCSISLFVNGQSKDIAMGVDRCLELKTEKDFNTDIGAGDQGMMFGYACTETSVLMPLPIMLAHQLTHRLACLRKDGTLAYLRPDGKAQVTVLYENGAPKSVATVVIAAQHNAQISMHTLKEDIKELVIKEVVPEHLLSDGTKYFINSTGRFEEGGPRADTGLTGRKIIVDTYGGTARHGGGCFSGKDATKVDRSASYAARYVAKNIVAARLAEQCELQLAYAIGVAQPVSVMVNSFGTGKISDEEIERLIKKTFDLRPGKIIEQLELRRPIFRKTASYGHFGREEEDFSWEKTDKIAELKVASNC